MIYLFIWLLCGLAIWVYAIVSEGNLTMQDLVKLPIVMISGLLPILFVIMAWLDYWLDKWDDKILWKRKQK